MKSIFAYFKNDDGTTSVEYVMIASVIALAIFSTQSQIAPGLNAIFNNVVTILAN
ncbi:MAG: Flp family type IVb pilin [Filomicrobium sp.]